MMNMPSRVGQKTRKVWTILCLAVKKFLRIDGAQWAGAFAFNAFFSLFPLIILLVTIASVFIDRDLAGREIIAYMESYVPISGKMQSYIFDTIAGVAKVQGQAGAVAFLILVWVAIQCFTTLICATNRAWGAGVQLVAATAEKPSAARYYGGCGSVGYCGAGAGKNGEGLAFAHE